MESTGFVIRLIGDSNQSKEIILNEEEVRQINTIWNMIQDLDDGPETIEIQANPSLDTLLLLLLGRKFRTNIPSEESLRLSIAGKGRIIQKQAIKSRPVKISDFMKDVEEVVSVLNFLNYLDVDSKLFEKYIETLSEKQPQILTQILWSVLPRWLYKSETGIELPDEIICILGRIGLVHHLAVPLRIVELCHIEKWFLTQPELFFGWKPLFEYVAENWDRLWTGFREDAEFFQNLWYQMMFYQKMEYLVPLDQRIALDEFRKKHQIFDTLKIASYLNLPTAIQKQLRSSSHTTRNAAYAHHNSRLDPPWTPLELALLNNAVDALPILLHRVQIHHRHPFQLVQSPEAFNLVVESGLDLNTNKASDLVGLRNNLPLLLEALDIIDKSLGELIDPAFLVSPETLEYFQEHQVPIQLEMQDIPKDWDLEFLLKWILESNFQLSDTETKEEIAKWFQHFTETPEQVRELFDILATQLDPTDLFEWFLEANDEMRASGLLDLVPRNLPFISLGLWQGNPRFHTPYPEMIPFLIQSGFDLEAIPQNAFVEPPLFEAIKTPANWKYIVPLLKAGANPRRNFFEMASRKEGLVDFLLPELRKAEMDEYADKLEDKSQ